MGPWDPLPFPFVGGACTSHPRNKMGGSPPQNSPMAALGLRLSRWNLPLRRQSSICLFCFVCVVFSLHVSMGYFSGCCHIYSSCMISSSQICICYSIMTAYVYMIACVHLCEVILSFCTCLATCTLVTGGIVHITSGTRSLQYYSCNMSFTISASNRLSMSTLFTSCYLSASLTNTLTTRNI